MRILLLGDYSACHLTLGRALSRLGHSVTVATDGCHWMQTERPYDLRRPLPGKPGGALLYARLRWLRPLRGYDVVSLISPSFAWLKPRLLRDIFDRLRRDNGAVFLTAAGTDKAMMDYYLSPGCALAYTEFKNPDGTPNHRTDSFLAENRRWQQGALADLCEYVYDHVAGAATTLYEYHLAMEARLGSGRAVYTGLPVEPVPAATDMAGTLDDGRPLRILLGRDRYRMPWKGTDRLEQALCRAVARHRGAAVVQIVENLPYGEYLRCLDGADILVDQLYSYSPALNALLAMARGKAVISGGEEDFYRFIGEDSLRPVFNPRPDDDALDALCERILTNPGEVQAAAAQARGFVARHNDADLVARRFLDLWNRLC